MWASTFSQVTIYITVYSIVGWAVSCAYRSVRARKFVNTGIFRGPYCPAFGIGVVLVLLATDWFTQNPLVVYPVAFAIVVALELIISLIIEAVFQVRLNDYSARRLNIKGRVCLVNSAVYALGGTAAACFVHKYVYALIGMIRQDVQRIIASLIIVLLVFEVIRALGVLERLSSRAARLRESMAGFGDYGRALMDEGDFAQNLLSLAERCESGGGSDVDREIMESIKGLAGAGSGGHKFGEYRFLMAFPELQIAGVPDSDLAAVRRLLDRTRPTLPQRIKGLASSLKSTTSATASGIEPFAKGLSFYKMVWVFTIASVIGYMQEMLFCFITMGIIESRQGMVYGPFCQVYGFGAVILVLLLSSLAKKNDRWVFFGGALLGGLYEVAASIVQEAMFGTYMWDYTYQNYSLFGGRTSLQFMLFWGILSVALIKFIYPKLSGFIERIPKRQGVVLSWALIIFLSLDMAVSAMAITRWSDRVAGNPAENAYEEFMDAAYPDEVMWEIYPNMRFMSNGDPRQQTEQENRERLGLQ